MKDNLVCVIILRRKAADVSPRAIKEIRAAFPGKKVVFRTTHPKDHWEHLLDCGRFRAEAVYLPDRPIPSSAQERGIPHITYTPDGLKELKPLVPKFKKFRPRY